MTIQGSCHSLLRKPCQEKEESSLGMDSNLSLRLSFPPLPRVNRSKHHRVTLQDQCSAIQKIVSGVVSCCGFQSRWLHCKHLLNLASIWKTEICLFLLKDKVVFWCWLEILHSGFCFQQPSSSTTNQICSVTFQWVSVSVYICFLRLKLFWKDKLQKISDHVWFPCAGAAYISREDRYTLAASVACGRYQSSIIHCQQATFTVWLYDCK